MFHADPAGVDQAIAEAMRTGKAIEDVEREKLGYDHAELGDLLAKKWNLPADVCAAIRQHHAEVPAGQVTLTSVVCEADRFCVAHGVLPGYVIPGEPGTSSRPDPEIAHVLNQADTLMSLITRELAGVHMVA